MRTTSYSPFCLDHLASLGSFIEDSFRKRPCDGTRRLTKEWILAHGMARQSKQILKELARRGGCCCDCEVLTNVVGKPIHAA